MTIQIVFGLTDSSANSAFKMRLHVFSQIAFCQKHFLTFFTHINHFMGFYMFGKRFVVTKEFIALITFVRFLLTLFRKVVFFSSCGPLESMVVCS